MLQLRRLMQHLPMSRRLSSATMLISLLQERLLTKLSLIPMMSQLLRQLMRSSTLSAIASSSILRLRHSS